MKASIIKRQKREHSMWEADNELKGKFNDITMRYLTGFGQWKYLFSSKKGKISMIEIMLRVPRKKRTFPNQPFDHVQWFWEIYAEDNPNIFGDVIRFNTRKEAEKAIKKYLQ